MSTPPPRTRQRVAIGSLVLAALVAMASLGGILLPDVYVRESFDWRGQALGQDWFDLVVAVPWLVLCAVGTLRGRSHWHLLLGGALLFILYTFFIYAFAIHFNTLFLIYCAALGLAFYLTVSLLHGLTLGGQGLTATRRTPVRSTGILLIVIGGLFALLWLGEIVPAIAGGRPPESVATAGLLTNPVHVIDLAIVLPAHVIAGVALLRRRPAGALFAPPCWRAFLCFPDRARKVRRERRPLLSAPRSRTRCGVTGARCRFFADLGPESRMASACWLQGEVPYAPFSHGHCPRSGVVRGSRGSGRSGRWRGADRR